MTDADHENRLPSPAEEPREMPLPSDPKGVFHGGLFILAALASAYWASEIVLPLILAFILKLLLQPAVRALEQVYVTRTLASLLLIVVIFGDNRRVNRRTINAGEQLGCQAAAGRVAARRAAVFPAKSHRNVATLLGA
jgi:hypothetical protein